MGTRAVWMFRRLEGLFAVYKPPGVHWKLVRDRIESNLLKGMLMRVFKTSSWQTPDKYMFLFLTLYVLLQAILHFASG